jgi:hypothetical protein
LVQGDEWRAIADNRKSGDVNGVERGLPAVKQSDMMGQVVLKYVPRYHPESL